MGHFWPITWCGRLGLEANAAHNQPRLLGALACVLRTATADAVAGLTTTHQSTR
jgi:hypothetical protein